MRNENELLKLVNIDLTNKNKLIKSIYHNYAVENKISYIRLMQTDPCDLKSLVDYSLIKSAMEWNGDINNIDEFIKFAYKKLENDIYESLYKIDINDIDKVKFNEYR